MAREHAKKSFLDEKVTSVFRFFNFSFAFPFSPFLFFLLQWLTFYWACLQLKKLLRKHHQDGQFLPWSSQRKFCCEFFTQLFEHFCAYLRFHSANHSEMGINGKIFPPAEVEYRWCQFWSQVMTSEVEERWRLITAGYGRQRCHGLNKKVTDWAFVWARRK